MDRSRRTRDLPHHRATRSTLVSFVGALLVALAATPALADRAEVDYAFIPLPAAGAELAQPLPKYNFMFGDPARWPGPLRWRYNPANAPSAFSDPDATASHIARTLDTWARSCGVTHAYEGITATPPNRRLGNQPDFENVVGWGTLEGQTAGVTYAWYVPSPGVRELVDTDVILSPDRVTGPNSMERTAKHEWGHALGLGHSDRAGMLMSGPPDTAYNNLTSFQFDDVRGCRCLYGPSASEPSGFACGVPRLVDLGNVLIGAPTPSRGPTITNSGNAPLAITGRSSTSRDLVVQSGCAADTSIAPGASCTMSLVATAPAAGTFNGDVLLTTSDGPYLVNIRFTGVSTPPAPAVPALVEYRHAGFGHYFVTSIAAEMAALDTGTIAGWVRTGYSIPVYAAPAAQTVSVCRFFSARFAPKSSHFYTALASECEAVKRNADWQFEGDVFHIALPDAAGNCRAGTQAVYRLYNNGASGAPNHRFTIDAGVRAAMIAQGWVPEGAGAGVTMCTPL